MYLLHHNKENMVLSFEQSLDYIDSILIESANKVKGINLRIQNPYLDKIKLKEVNLVISRKNLYKLDQERRNAIQLANPYLGSNIKISKHKAILEIDGEKVPVTINLKGDNEWHFDDDIFSLRVKTRNKSSFLGMVKFDIQDPLKRSHHYDYLVREQLKKYELITPELMLVKYSINGKYKGVALIEEIFTSSTASRYKRRSDGVSLKFNDNYFQDSLYHHGASFSDEYGHFMNGFESQEISPVSKKDYRKNYFNWLKATSILMAYQNNEIDLQDAFDVPKLLQYFALSEIWGIWHTTQMHNIRFYFNPINSKLEPWWWDNRPGLGLNNHSFNILGSPFVKRVLSNKETYIEFKKILVDVINDVINPEIYTEIKLTESRILGHVNTRKFPIEDVINRASSIKDALKKSNKSDDIFIDTSKEILNFPQPIRAVAILENNKLYIKVANSLPIDVRLNELYVVLYDKNSLTKKKIDVNIKDILLKTNNHDTSLEWNKIFVGNYDDFILSKVKVMGVATTLTNNIEYKFTGKLVGSLSALPNINDIKKIIEKYPFIESQGKKLVISKGVWNVLDFIRFPRGYSLVIGAGTTLKFHDGAGFLVNGGLEINGTYKDNVTLTSHNSNWSGIVVLASGASVNLNNLILKNTNAEYTNDSWGSGLLVYDGNTTINNVSILDSNAEDAINLVSGNFLINNLYIKNSKSDAIDIDFSTGTIDNSHFENIGGDAIDTSGSRILIKNSYFTNVRDKSVSVGEASFATIEGIDVSKSIVGVAVKDSSKATIKKSKFNEIDEIGVFVYNKKSFFSGAFAKVTSTSFSNVKESVVVQNGSKAILDDRSIDTRIINIRDLYDYGYMKKY
jgi:hypothetical protein